MNEIGQHKIKIYEFPEDDTDGTTAKLKSRVPFAVVGSNTTLEMEGKKVRGRRYPWGVVEGYTFSFYFLFFLCIYCLSNFPVSKLYFFL